MAQPATSDDRGYRSIPPPATPPLPTPTPTPTTRTPPPTTQPTTPRPWHCDKCDDAQPPNAAAMSLPPRPPDAGPGSSSALDWPSNFSPPDPQHARTGAT